MGDNSGRSLAGRATDADALESNVSSKAGIPNAPDAVGAEESWWMIERQDLSPPPQYFYWTQRPGTSKKWPHGAHDWTPDWRVGEHFATRAAAVEHTNGDPLLSVVEHCYIKARPDDGTADVMIGEFVATYEEAAAGLLMDADTAQELAREFRRMKELIVALQDRPDVTLIDDVRKGSRWRRADWTSEIVFEVPERLFARIISALQAQGMEAGTAETSGSAEGDSPVAESDAP